jgi:peroxiredoxin
MNYFLISGLVLVSLVVIAGCWLGWQLLRQNGRILLRLDELEKRLDELEFGEPGDELGSSGGDEKHSAKSEIRNSKSTIDQSLLTSAATDGDDRASRFGNRSLARSKIKRDGLKAGTPAPDFRLPCLDGSERSLQDFLGRRVLLVFSDPHCGPCQVLAPKLEKFYQENCHTPVASATHPGTTGRPLTPSLSPSEGERVSEERVRGTPPITVVMISRGDPKENRAKVKEHRLTFPVGLQQRWEVSRLYAMFATPMAYLIDESGVITHDVAVGVEAILNLMAAWDRPVACSLGRH